MTLEGTEVFVRGNNGEADERRSGGKQDGAAGVFEEQHSQITAKLIAKPPSETPSSF